jgi:isochorismate pyruvate lyase
MKPAKDCTSIEEVREAIDSIDEQIIALLGERYKYVKEIVRFKEPTEESIVARSRFDAVISTRRTLAEENGLNPDLIEKLYRDLLSHFIDEELKIIKKK